MKRIIAVAAVAAVQLALVGVAVAPQLSARLVGDTYVLRVAPVDPIDPFRGAYVALDYPDLTGSNAPGDGPDDGLHDGERGRVFVPLEADGEVWVAGALTRERPGSGPYLTCDDSSWRLRCGIESLFASQARALELEQTLAGGAYAEVRVDSRGNAALVDVRATP